VALFHGLFSLIFLQYGASKEQGMILYHIEISDTFLDIPFVVITSMEHTTDWKSPTTVA
jgi:hypothetical protein